ncbi:hypothetical protein [Rothia terrae]|uniref:hypothetical protein n=1 Tax=Rothia terrae TaxID=396015 RepID=UPI0028817ACB|nr:hypothetical protein [Rothia terrae]MDT0188880.1 hypothetical protein [Rothia terrae]
MNWKLKNAINKDSEFLKYINRMTNSLNNESRWIIDESNRKFIFQIAANPFDEEVMQIYFSEILSLYRSGLDHLISNYALKNNLEIKNSSFPIRMDDKSLRIWRKILKWPDEHSIPVTDFLRQYQPYVNSKYYFLKDLKDFRDTDEHRVSIIPSPHAQPYFGLDIPVSFDARTNKRNDFNKWAIKIKLREEMPEGLELKKFVSVIFTVKDETRNPVLKTQLLPLLENLRVHIPELVYKFNQKFIDDAN